MTIKIDWTSQALKQRDQLIATDPKLRNFFAATYESLKAGEIPLRAEGIVEIYVEFTKYKLVLDIETNRIAKVKYIDITEVK